MPWEKSFDETDFVDQVMHVFWEKGFASTSISDLTEATGVKRGSLYNAFEGKDDLFLRSLLKYDEQRTAMLCSLESAEDPHQAILAFLDRVVKSSLNDPDRKGCLLVNTSLEYPQHDVEVQKVVSNAFKEMTNCFEKLIKRGQDRGIIPDNVEPRPTAKALMALVVGMRVMGRGTFGKTAIQQIAGQAKRLIS